MSQLLTPTNGGVIPEIQTTVATPQLNVLSEQFILANNLQERPTEWVPGGRPIYRRLPATSETYQIDFYNLVAESNIVGNTRVLESIEEVGYVFVPYGESINGPLSLEVVASTNSQDLLIKSGAIVWKYGKNEVIPTIVNLKTLDVASGKYALAYQLLYDDSPVPLLYSVNDFALTGLTLDITASSDPVIGWRFGATNAFLNSSSLFWSNEDTFFPSYTQPNTAHIQWQSQLSQAYTKLVLRCPSGTSYSGTATLSYVEGVVATPVETVNVISDASGQFFEFSPTSPSLQTGWQVSFSSTTVSIQSVTVSGTLTLLEPQSAPSPRAVLVMYPVGTLPPTVPDAQGNPIPATYCTLAEIDVGVEYDVLKIQDTRSIIHRDYVPVANWLTMPFDDNLIDLYEQVSDYAILWMAPPKCLKQEYLDLETKQITVEV